MISRRSLLLATSILPTSTALAAIPERWQAGTHYEEIKPPLPRQAQGKLELIEFFWYGCQHCYTLEPHVVLLTHYRPQVQLRRLPVAWHPQRVPHSRLFFALNALGREEDLHATVFDTIHRLQDPLDTLEKQLAFVRAHGIDTEKFRAAYDAASVDAELRSVDKLARSYRITGVPALALNGKYMSDAVRTKGEPELVKLMMHLIDHELGNRT